MACMGEPVWFWGDQSKRQKEPRDQTNPSKSTLKWEGSKLLDWEVISIHPRTGAIMLIWASQFFSYLAFHLSGSCLSIPFPGSLSAFAMCFISHSLDPNFNNFSVLFQHKEWKMYCSRSQKFSFGLNTLLINSLNTQRFWLVPCAVQ